MPARGGRNRGKHAFALGPWLYAAPWQHSIQNALHNICIYIYISIYTHTHAQTCFFWHAFSLAVSLYLGRLSVISQLPEVKPGAKQAIRVLITLLVSHVSPRLVHYG